MRSSQDDHRIEDLDKLTAKLKRLLDKAESTSNSDEKAVIEQRVREILKKYRLSQEDLIAVDEKSIKPVLRDFTIARLGVDYGNWLYTAFLSVVDHVGARATAKWEQNSEGKYFLVGKAVGYDIDLRYAELLWSSIRMEFITKLDPEVDPKLSDEENIYRLRSAGIARKDVAEMLWGKWTHSNSAKVGRIYKEECARRGETPALDGKGIHLKTFKEVYAREFVWRVDYRLRLARDGVTGQAGAMVFAGREERVQEAFYEFFPELRPKEASPVAEEDAPTETAKKARKRLATTETKAYQKKLNRMYNSPAALAGARVGIDAANNVNINRVADATERLGYETDPPAESSGKELEA